ncbi:MAG: rod shape-determining protein RodA [Bacteroidota bacterium]
MSTNATTKLNLDWSLVILYSALVLMGWFTIYSAAYNPELPSPFSFSEEYGKQAVWIGVSFFLIIVVLYLDAEVFNKFAVVIYLFFVLLLLLVLVIGKEVNGAKAWFGIGDFGIQPSEFSKIGVGLFLARFISANASQFKSLKTRMSALAIIGFPAGLILLQPDVGSMLTFLAFILVMYREGLSGNVLIFGFASVFVGTYSIVVGSGTTDYPYFGNQSSVWTFILVLILLGVIAALIVRQFVVPRSRKLLYTVITISALLSSAMAYSINYVVDHVLEPHHKERIYVMLSLPVEREDATYNSEMAKITVGSGGFFGKGFHEGPMTQNNYVPEQWTDFIFSAVAEEWGFLGSTLVIVLFFALIFRLVVVAERQRSQFSRIYGYCVAAILFLHLLINIGMVLGLAPIIGIPLPFFSYGGSSLMAFTILLFIMIRLDAERLSIFR